MKPKYTSQFYEAYRPRIIAYLNRVRDTAHCYGYTTSHVRQRKGVDWAFDFTLNAGTQQSLKIVFAVLRSEDYDTQATPGVAFEITVEELGGRIIDGWDAVQKPQRMWHRLDRPEEIAICFEEYERINPQEVLNIVDNYRKGQSDGRDQTLA